MSERGKRKMMKLTHTNRIRTNVLTLAGFILVLLAMPAQAQQYFEWSFPGAPHSIAFASSRDGNNEVYVMDPNGDNQSRRTITAAPSNDQRPDISPDGNQIVF